MRSNVTTTKNGFRVEDVTFRNMRKQSEILSEGVSDTSSNEEDEDTVEVPNSLTPEQIIAYFEQIISNTEDRQKKKVYSQTIRWIKELEEAKVKLKTYRSKELAKQASEDLSDSI